jgi:hypothetical protein
MVYTKTINDSMIINFDYEGHSNENIHTLNSANDASLE